MLNYFAKRNRHRATSGELYRAIVARARHPDLYRSVGVADTFDGRYELLMLHVIFLIRRLRSTGQMTLAQALFDLLFADMDQALREMGVSDVAVARRIRPMAEAIYGRAAAYERALCSGAEPGALVSVIERNAFPDGAPAGAADALAAYVRRLAAAIEAASPADAAVGRIDWPEPVAPEPVAG